MKDPVRGMNVDPQTSKHRATYHGEDVHFRSAGRKNKFEANPVTQAALDTLRSDGVRIVMLTGDNRTTAEAVARKLGIKKSKPTFYRRTKIASSRSSRPKGASEH